MDGKSYKHSFEGSRPGCDTKSLAWLAMNKNANLVIIGRDQDSNLRVVGSEFMAAKFESAEGTTGKSGEDSKADVFVIVSQHADPPRLYAGTIPTTEASS